MPRLRLVPAERSLQRTGIFPPICGTARPVFRWDRRWNCPVPWVLDQFSTPMEAGFISRATDLEVWRVPLPATDDPERLRLSIEVRSGLEVNDNSTIQKLTQAGWLQRKRRLEQLGGPCDVAE
jgi:hypothetical protein